MNEGQEKLQELDNLRDELFPLSRRATMLYAILRSLATIHREYQFTLPYFLELFDEAIGGVFPPEYSEDSDNDDVSIIVIFSIIHNKEVQMMGIK